MRFAMVVRNHNPMDRAIFEREVINICIFIFFRLPFDMALLIGTLGYVLNFGP